jgi:hypothetical protein
MSPALKQHAVTKAPSKPDDVPRMTSTRTTYMIAPVGVHLCPAHASGHAGVVWDQIGEGVDWCHKCGMIRITEKIGLW